MNRRKFFRGLIGAAVAMIAPKPILALGANTALAKGMVYGPYIPLIVISSLPSYYSKDLIDVQPMDEPSGLVIPIDIGKITK